MALKYNDIKPLLRSERHSSKWVGIIGLTIGLVLLLLAVQMFTNIQSLLREEAPKQSRGFDYLSVSKSITNDNMGKDNSFTPNDLALLNQEHKITQVAPVYSNQFRAMATAGDVLPFSTDLFLESVNSAFLDTLPTNFDWHPGQSEVPIIFSSDFLEMYNVFAPSQGLPQVSAKTISSINIFLQCSGVRGTQNFKASIVGLSDRINSILVPESFLKWGNAQLAGDTSARISRIIIKVKDANDPELLHFLDENNYHINKDKVRFGRIKGVLQSTVGALGVFGLLVVLLALILFAFYLQLTISNSRDNIHLLLLIGYSPGWLAKSFTFSYFPLYVTITFISLIIVSVIQFMLSTMEFTHTTLSPFLSAPAWITVGVLIILILYLNTRMVRKEILKLT